MRYKLWLTGKEDGVGGVGKIVKEELSEKVAEVKRVSDRVMTLVAVYKEYAEVDLWAYSTKWKTFG